MRALCVRRRRKSTACLADPELLSAIRTEELGNRQTNVMLDQTAPGIGEPCAVVDDLRDALRQFERRMTIKLYLAVCAGAFLVKVLDFLIG